MRRRTFAALAAAALLAGITVAPTAADARTFYPTYRYTACDKHHALLGSVYVCESMVATRQSDDLGFIIHSANIYVDVPDSNNECNDSLLDDPAVTNLGVEIHHETAGAWGNDLLSKDDPNLDESNDCAKTYTFGSSPGVLLTDRIHIQMEFYYKVRLNGAHDKTTRLFVNVSESGFTAAYDCSSLDGVDKCYRTAV